VRRLHDYRQASLFGQGGGPLREDGGALREGGGLFTELGQEGDVVVGEQAAVAAEQHHRAATVRGQHRCRGHETSLPAAGERDCHPRRTGCGGVDRGRGGQHLVDVSLVVLVLRHRQPARSHRLHGAGCGGQQHHHGVGAEHFPGALAVRLPGTRRGLVGRYREQATQHRVRGLPRPVLPQPSRRRERQDIQQSGYHRRRA
jgi:hypothetical protein